MFSGIIETVGTIHSISKYEDKSREDWRFSINCNELDVMDLKQGDSIAINGACLTVVDWSDNLLDFDVSAETLSCTNFQDLKTGSPVNLERALRLSDRLNGHLVSGHIDTVARVVGLKEEARSWRYEFSLAKEYLKYISSKGSVTVDGVSLTINTVSGEGFSVNIIPHTLQQTLFKEYKIGSEVNIEVDLIARYLQNLLAAQS